jgi:hypothetical protein
MHLMLVTVTNVQRQDECFLSLQQLDGAVDFDFQYLCFAFESYFSPTRM